MKYLLLLLISIVLSKPYVLFGIGLSIEDAIGNINQQSEKVAKNEFIQDISTLALYLRIYKLFLIEGLISEGGKTNINNFIKSKSLVQNNFIDVWGKAADAISTAAYKDATTAIQEYYPTIEGLFWYSGSTSLLETPNAISTFNDIATNLKDPQVKQILQHHLKEDPTVIFKNIYYTLLYQWLTYRSLRNAQEALPLQPLESIIDVYKIDIFKPELLIDTNDSKLMNELKRKYQILSELLESKTLLKTQDEREAYLALVRDYMLDVVIPPMQLQPLIRIIPEKEAKEIKRENLMQLSKKLKSTGLPEDNPLSKMVAQDLEQLQPELATSQVLLSHLTNLSTQLIQLHASITR